MKYILLKDIYEVGKKNDIVSIESINKRNELLFNGSIIIANKENLENISLKINSEDLKLQIEDIYLSFEKESNGLSLKDSISSKDILKKLLEFNIELNKKDIKLPKIYSFGEYIANIDCQNSITAKLKIFVSSI